MKRAAYILAISCFLCGISRVAQAQNAQADSLKKVLQTSTGIQRVNTLNNLFNATRLADTAAAKKYLDEAFALSKELAYTKGLINAQINHARLLNRAGSYLDAAELCRKTLPQAQKQNLVQEQVVIYQLMGRSYREGSKFVKARNIFNQTISFLKAHPNDKELSEAYNDLGITEYYVGDLEAAIQNFKHSWKYKDKIGDKKGMGGLTMNIGVILYRTGHIKESIEYYNKSLAVFQSVHDTLGIANALTNIAMSEEHLGNNREAFKTYMQTAKIYRQLNNLEMESNVMESMGNNLTNRGDYAGALKYNLQALKLREKNNEKRLIAISYNSLTGIYKAMRDTAKAIESIEKAIAINLDIGDEYGYAQSLLILADIQVQKKMFGEARKSIKTSIAIGKKLGDIPRLALAYFTQGKLYFKQHQNDSAIVAYNQSLKIIKETGDESLEASLYGDLGAAYAEQKKYPAAIAMLTQARKQLQVSNSRYELSTAYMYLARSHAGLNQYRQAYEYYNLYHTGWDSLFNEKMSSSIAEMQARYDVEKQQKANEILQQKSQLNMVMLQRNEEARNKQAIIIYAILGLVALFVVLLVVMLRSNVQRKKTNNQLTAQNLQINRQKSTIEEKNKDITDSINYARRIQDALLPPAAMMSRYFNDAFVLYKPKDIVSGDFYWVKTLPGRLLFAVVDCTGHGVPGAFVSIVGHNNLNRAVNEFGLNRPADILNKLNELVEEAFDAQGSDIRDGMDISLCAIDTTTHELEWAGANNPLWIIKGSGEFAEVKADKQPIGKYAGRKPFTGHSVQLHKNDSIYIFSDGYADQFGGPAGKKFKYSQLREILVSIKDMPMQSQLEAIHSRIETWRGALEQVDDICIIGMRV